MNNILFLRKGANNSVDVKTEGGWYLIKFKSNGTLYIQSGVPPSLGFKLTDNNKIQEKEGDL